MSSTESPSRGPAYSDATSALRRALNPFARRASCVLGRCYLPPNAPLSWSCSFRDTWLTRSPQDYLVTNAPARRQLKFVKASCGHTPGQEVRWVIGIGLHAAYAAVAARLGGRSTKATPVSARGSPSQPHKLTGCRRFSTGWLLKSVILLRLRSFWHIRRYVDDAALGGVRPPRCHPIRRRDPQ